MFKNYLTPDEIVQKQLFSENMNMPFSEFHEAMEYVFGRQIEYLEFADIVKLQKEYFDIKDRGKRGNNKQV
jgi:hypothetical protein